MVKSKKRTSNFRFEAERKLFHVCCTTILLIVIWYMDDLTQRYFLLGLVVLGLVLSFIEKKSRIPLISPALDRLERKKFRDAYPGKSALMLAVGLLLLSLLFNDLLLVTGFLIVLLGDPIGHLYGMKFGKIKVPWDKSKDIEGRILGFFTCWLVAYLLWQKLLIFHFYGWWVIPAGMLVGMLVETLPLGKFGLDDNLTAPFAAALTIYLLI